MNNLKIIDIYPTRISGVNIGSPVDHMIKSIEHDLSNIDDILEKNEVIHSWLKYMPHIDDVKNIKAYQENYNNINNSYIHNLDSDFKKIKVTMPSGQTLFRKGCCVDKNKEHIIERYISTTIDPVFAQGIPNYDCIKKYIVIKILSPDIKFYLFNQNVKNGYAESEVLLEKGIILIQRKMCKAKNWYNDEYEDIYCVDAYKQ